MCGIHVIFDKTSKLDEGPIQKMVQYSQHRGDDESQWKSVSSDQGTWFFGANRLMITDHSPAASQPMVLDGDVLVYNGEVYNTATLKNRLLAEGMTFISSSDTEVLFRWIQRKGLDFLSDVQAMYAFAYYDAQANTATFTRDSRGMKPLYFYESEQYVIFSSEIQAIFSSGLASKTLNERAVRSYLTYKYVRPPETFFEGIHCVLPGEIIRINLSGITRVPAKLSPVEAIKSSDPVQTLDTLLSESVLNHIPEKIPFSLLLSGGIDSTLLLALLHREGIRIPVFSFTSSSKDRPFGTKDYKYARLAANQYQADLHVVESDQLELTDKIDEYINDIDQPVGDSAGFITWLLCKDIGEEMKVTWSGAGADELFAGYNRHAAFKLYLERYNWILKVRGLGQKLASTFLGGPHQRKFFDSINHDPSTTFLQFCQQFEDKASSEWKDVLHDRTEHHLQHALQFDLNNYLVNDVLAINDSMGMRSGVEVRSPYLDASLVAWSQQIPATQKMAQGTKWMLCDLLKSLGGGSYVRRKKEGFGLPIDGWIDSNTRNLWSFDDESDIIHRFVSKGLIADMLQKQISGKGHFGPALWSILVLSKWLKKEFS